MRPAWLVLLAACHTAWTEDAVGDVRLLSVSRTSSLTAHTKVDVELQPDDTSLALTCRTPSDTTCFVWRVLDPDGEERLFAQDWWAAAENRTTAPFADHVTTLLFPLDAEDAPLSAGWWTFDLRTKEPGDPIDVAVAVRADPDPSSGTVAVDVNVDDDLATDARLNGIATAIARWRDDIYRPNGLDLDAEVYTADLPNSLAPPGQDDLATYEALAVASARDRVQVVIVEQISEQSGVLGIAGGIPGPITPTGASAVTVSWTESAGRDGALSALEARLLGETMAHEVGHYLGLFHPIELPTDGDAVTFTDALADTPDCTRFSRCIAVLGANVMFPAPVCDQADNGDCVGFVEQVELTPSQSGTAGSWPFVGD